MVALAKAACLNIVCDDFVSQRLPLHSNAHIEYGKETTAADTLRQIAKCGYLSTNWYLNADSKLLVGWEHTWKKQHLNLVPESLLLGLREKQEKDGAELDDIAPLFALTREQLSTWFEYLGLEMIDHTELWRLYNALAPDDKKLAHSESGLPLSKFDTSWICSFSEQQIPKDIETQKKLALEVSTLVMRIKQKPLDKWSITYPGDLDSYKPGPNGVKKHTYVMEISDTNTDDRPAELDIGIPFPVFTPERETELRKNAESKAKTAAP